MFIPRLVSSIALFVIVFFVFIFKGGVGLSVFLFLGLALLVAGVNEFSKLLRNIGIDSFSWGPEIFSAALFLSVIVDKFCDFGGRLALAAVALFPIYCWLRVLFSGNDKAVAIKVAGSAASFFLIAVPLNFIVLVYARGYYFSYVGVHLILFLILVTKLGDIGAYVIGTLSSKLPKGNHKIVPSISPKKSLEGFIGGFAASVIAAGAIAWSFHFETFGSLAIGALLFAGGFAGDLSESVLKRIAGAKDSGSIIPGIGGALDLLDSLLINAPLFYLLLSIIKIV